MNCCYQCTKRCVGCHASCESYNEFKRQRDEVRKRERLDSFKRAIEIENVYFSTRHPAKW